ncbi:MAG: YybS family protein [Thermoanaerobaculales bacterium]|nr:YybS family protein [Thermoanaerobaculales bacterium]
MTSNDEPREATGVPAASRRLPSFGAGATGLVSLLLVAGLVAVPLFGALVAPLGLIPMLHFQREGGSGLRAWGWVVALLAAASLVGLGGIPAILLAAYGLIVVIPAVSVEIWVRAGWSESRWIAVTVAMLLAAILGTSAVVALPDGPVDAARLAMRAAADDAKQMYGAMGFAEGEIELAYDASERVIPWVIPAAVVAYLVAVLFWIRPRVPLLGSPVAVGPFESYRNDEWIAAAFAVGGIGALFLDGTPRWVALNLLIAVLLLYFVQGLAMIRAHLARWIGRGWFVRWGVGLLCLYPPMPILVATLGVADSFFSLRPDASDDGGNP